MQADMVLEKELRVRYLGLQAAEGAVYYTGVTRTQETSKPAPIVTHFLQQGHTYSNKTTPPNSAIPYGQAFKHLSLWELYLFKPPHARLHRRQNGPVE